MTKYVKNELGVVHSVTDEHFEHVLHEETESGNRYLLHGWSEITEDEARKASPRLFGKPDPAIVYTSKELAEVRERQKWDAELAADQAASAEEDQTEPEAEPEPTPATKSK